MRRLLAATLLAAVLPLAARAAVPEQNWSDMWYDTAESGWGISFTQHRPSNQVFAVWYTYDPRAPDPGGQFKPLWIVMPGGTWTTPTRITGSVYVLLGPPVTQPFAASAIKLDSVGTFTIQFNDSASATFTYDIKPAANADAGSPSAGLPTMSGTKLITRQAF